MRPGETILPFTLIVRAASVAGMLWAMRAIAPFSTATSRMPSSPFAGSITVPPWSSRSYMAVLRGPNSTLALVMANDPDDTSEDFATLFARHEAGPTLQVGQVVKGRVFHITAENVFVDRKSTRL